MLLSKCPICNYENIHKVKGSVKRRIHGKEISIPSVTYWFCGNCGEKIFPREAMETMNKFIEEKVKRITKSRVA